VQSLGSLGSTQTAQTGYKPRHALIRPLAPNQVALDHILASSLHLGHRSIFYNRHASPHIYGRRHKTDIIDARQTLAHLRRAAEVVRGVVEHDGVVVFMSALKGTERAVLDAASACGPNGFAVTTYKQGFLLNAEVVYDGYDFSDLRTGARGRASAADDKVTPGMLMPSLLVVLTPRSHLDAIAEANIIRCPTMGLVDSDTDPRIVTYSIPGNDDGVRGIQLVAGVLGQAGKDGLQRRQQRCARARLGHSYAL
jgi:small subunit ribosomal protein S2